jgi:hypothetical protein
MRHICATFVATTMIAVSRAIPRSANRIGFSGTPRFSNVPVTGEQPHATCQAFSNCGKGRHPAGLNFGDCFSCALATGGNSCGARVTSFAKPTSACTAIDCVAHSYSYRSTRKNDGVGSVQNPGKCAVGNERRHGLDFRRQGAVLDDLRGCAAHRRHRFLRQRPGLQRG